MKNFLPTPPENLNKLVKDKGMYPGAQYPGVAWILEEVLHVDPRYVVLDGFYMDDDTYETFMFDQDGNKRKWENGEFAYLDVAWTKEQRQAIREWWEYIPPELKRTDNDV